ncbi:MAG TPA: polyprenyl synthetase family protein [Geminicoccaceae bacterium]|nr:polyprenyl synthetase family protein [Geminicoccaceae bacterium]
MTAVSSPLAGPSGSAKLEAIQALVEADMGRVNKLIIARLDSPISLIPQLAGHLVAAGGKRVRPMLTLIAAQLCGYRGNRHVPLAAAVEFIHTATLLHDDVVDESDLRRGLATANAIWGNKPSVLVGDFLFSRAFQLMVEDGSLEVLAILANASAVIAEGEVAQLMTANDAETTEARYLEVITAKTATLFAAAAQIGGVVGERPSAEVEALRCYGENLGIAFQLIDDVLDYSAREVVLGKSIGDDFRDGKITLPIVLAFARGDAEERRFWRRTLERIEQHEGDLAHAIELLKRRDALADSLSRATEFSEAAQRALGRFVPSAARRAMLDLADFCVERAY